MLTYFIGQKLRQGSVETACLCSTVSGVSANMMIQMVGPDFYPAEHCSRLEAASPLCQASGLGSSRGSTRTPTYGLRMWLELLSAWEWILRENIPRASVPRQKLYGLLWPSLGSHTVICWSSHKPTQMQKQETWSPSSQWEEAQRMCSHLRNLP